MTFETRDEVAKALDELSVERAHDYYDEPIPSETDDVVARLVKRLADSTAG